MARMSLYTHIIKFLLIFPPRKDDHLMAETHHGNHSICTNNIRIYTRMVDFTSHFNVESI
jgi:hypothetical protein